MPLSKIVAKSITDDTITTDQIADTSVHGRRNILINGAQVVNQRGVTQTFQNNGAYVTDRWAFRRSGTISGASYEVQQNDTSGLNGFRKCLQTKVINAALNPNAADNTRAYIKHTLEGQDLQHLMWGTSSAKPVTCSFYVRSPVTGTYCWSIHQLATNKTYIVEYTISAANTWERKVLTVPAPSTSDLGTVSPNDNTVELQMHWTMAGNVTGTSAHRDSANQWLDASGSDKSHTANQANAFATQNNIFQITGIQLEVGDISDPVFEHRSFAEELALCQRYFEETKLVAAGTVTSAMGDGHTWHYKATKRAAPTITKGTTTNTGSYTGGLTSNTNTIHALGHTFNTNGSSAGILTMEVTADAEL